MVRIGGGVFPEIKERDYLGAGNYRVDKDAGKVSSGPSQGGFGLIIVLSCQELLSSALQAPAPRESQGCRACDHLIQVDT